MCAFPISALLFAITAVGLPLGGQGFELYFGCGCFWHVQHEFIKAEESILGRSDANFTSVSGYAGGTGAKSTACYKTYGGAGYTEVVGMKIPEDKIGAFAEVFWNLFGGIDRVDTMDVGPEYRAAIGLPGGKQSPHFKLMQSSQKSGQQFRLNAGKGNDRDTLGEALVWVYDSDSFPFVQAEVYHQFHDDFMPGGKYPQSYNDLRNKLLAAGNMVQTGCLTDGSHSGGGSGGGSWQSDDAAASNAAASIDSASMRASIAISMLCLVLCVAA